MPNRHAHHAQIATDGTVLRVIVADPEYTTKLPGTWVRTWREGPTKGPTKNYAGPGYKFDAGRGAFIAPRPADATGLDETTCRWIVPAVAMPKPKEKP